MEKTKKRDKTKGLSKMESDKSSNNRAHKRTRTILDALVFFIIILALSFSIIIISSLPKDPTAYYRDYHESDEYVENSMQSILSSTVPKVVYMDSFGRQIEYSGQTLERLIIIELNNKALGSLLDGYNTSSLKRSFEFELGRTLNIAFGQDVSYIFTAVGDTGAISEETEPKIFISNMADPPEVKNTNPDYEKTISISKSEIKEVHIRLYLI